MGVTANVKGQMTVELMVALPVMMIVAVLAVNALLFIGDCAAFDRQARHAVVIQGSSLGYGVDSGQAAQIVESQLNASLDENVTVQVSCQQRTSGLICYTATAYFEPTLFGASSNETVFGVSLPPLRHSVSMTVDSYKPGVLL